MTISIIGAGRMARGIGTRFVSGGHHVVFSARDNSEAEDLATELNQGQKAQMAESRPWGEDLPGSVVVLAIPFQAVPATIDDYRSQLPGKIVVDITNPVDLATFRLLPPANSSGAEEIAKLLPKGTHIVKAFNTTFAGTLLQGQINTETLDVYIAGDDARTKAVVMGLVADSGLRALDSGPLHHAQYLEGMQLIHMELQPLLQSNWMSGIKIIS